MNALDIKNQIISISANRKAPGKLPNQILTWADPKITDDEGKELKNLYSFSLSCVAGDLPVLEIATYEEIGKQGNKTASKTKLRLKRPQKCNTNS